MSLENFVKPAGKIVCPADSFVRSFHLGTGHQVPLIRSLGSLRIPSTKKAARDDCGVSVLRDHSQHRGVLCRLACTALK